jgi:shingomyelin synthase
MVLVYLMAVTGIVMVSISRGHYTVDIILAYYITTRVFWMYHSMVANAELKVGRRPQIWGFLAKNAF